MAYVVDSMVVNGRPTFAQGDIQILTDTITLSNTTGSYPDFYIDSSTPFNITYTVQNISTTDYAQVWGFMYLTGQDPNTTRLTGSYWSNTPVNGGALYTPPATNHGAITGDLGITIVVGHIEGGGGGGGFPIDPIWLLIGSAAIGGTILVAILLSKRKKPRR